MPAAVVHGPPTTSSGPIWRMAHEVIERNQGLDNVVLIGLQTGGVPLAGQARRRRCARSRMSTCRWAASTWPSTATTSACVRCCPRPSPTSPFDLAGRVVVLVDDVLFTGRTIRAALDALTDFGRPRAVQLAVMVDRGHRELPIRPDYVGKNLPTRRDEVVERAGAPRRRTGGDDASEASSVDRRPRSSTASTRSCGSRTRFVEVSEPGNIPKVPALRGKTVVSLFYEDSTRTRLSASRPRPSASSADTMTFSVGTSSVKKGESVRDTLLRRSRRWESTPSSCATARPECRVQVARVGNLVSR